MEIDLKKIGVCVGSEIHGLTNWNGLTIIYWGIFDLPPKNIRLFELRMHLKKAYLIDSKKPFNAIKVYSFLLENEI